MQNKTIRLNLEPYIPSILFSAAIYDFVIADPCGPHAYPAYELHYLHSGEIQWKPDNGPLKIVTGGHCSLVQPMIRHRMTYDVMAPCKVLSICIKPNIPANCHPFSKKEVEAILSTLKKAGNAVVPANQEIDRQFMAIRDTLSDLAGRKPSVLQSAWLRTLFTHTLTGLFECFSDPQVSPHFYAITKAKKHIERNLDNAFKISDIAKVAGLKPSRFHELFLLETGLTPADYLLRRRLDLAYSLLKNTSQDITEIAHKLGFSSSQKFSTTFKKYFSVTPSESRTGLKK